MTMHDAEFSLVVIANEHCARFLTYLPGEQRLVEHATLANRLNDPSDTSRFAQRIARHIDGHYSPNNNTRACLVAPRPFLEILEVGLAKRFPNLVFATCAEDLTALSEDHILVRVAEQLALSEEH